MDSSFPPVPYAVALHPNGVLLPEPLVIGPQPSSRACKAAAAFNLAQLFGLGELRATAELRKRCVLE